MIPFSLYQNGDTVEKLRPMDILSVEAYYQKYRRHLFCCVPGCEARIEWAHRNGYPYFRTWRNSKHAENCPFAFESDPEWVTAQPGESVPIRVSSQHMRRSLSYANRKRQQEEGELSVDNHPTGSHNPNRPIRERKGSRLVPSVDRNARRASLGEREPPIQTRRSKDLTADDVSRYITVYGRVNQAEVKENSVRFFFDTEGRHRVSVLFFNAFRDGLPQQYGWVVQIAQMITEGKADCLATSCIGVCEWKDDRYEIQVMNEESISVGDTWLSVFMRDLRAA